MTTWYVRPDTSHSTTRNGLSYETAWGGWSAIVWGGAGVVAGDTLYVCGTHAITSPVAVGNHGATVNNRVTISGGYAADRGSIIASADGGVFLQVPRNYTSITNLTIKANKSFCIYLYAAAPITGVTIEKCVLNGGSASIISLDNTSNVTHTDLTIRNNDFIGGSGSSLGSAISWLGAASGAPLTMLNRVSILNNRFIWCSSTRAVIEMWVQPGANPGTKMTDIVATNNAFIGCSAVAMEIFTGVYGRNSGIRITDNTIHDQKMMGTLGGGFAIGGFGPSTTDGFGANVIARNKGYRLSGVTGMINVFYGTYRVFDNVGEDITTSTIDGTGILFDHGCDSCVAYGNKFSRLMGVPGVYYSGNGITILDATNIEVYGNVIEDAYCGIHFGNKETGQSSNIHNNTFIRCSMAVDVSSTAEKTTNFVRNNIFTAAGAVTSVRVSGGTWTGESNNAFSGFGSSLGHKISATSVTANPELDANYRPRSTALVRKGTYLGGRDFNGKHFYNPPNIGAVDDVTVTPRYGLTQG